MRRGICEITFNLIRRHVDRVRGNTIIILHVGCGGVRNVTCGMTRINLIMIARKGAK